MIKNLWILTEERPKRSVIAQIIERFARDHSIVGRLKPITINPMLDADGNFLFTYEVTGFESNKLGKIYLRTVSGKSSFVDFLIFHQVDEPTDKDIPIYAIEETKTGDDESRNTGIYQRQTKFVYIDIFFPGTKKIMLYNSQNEVRKKPSATNIFGARCLLTLGVDIMGIDYDKSIFKPFKTIDELIFSKNSMKRPPSKDNTPIVLTKEISSIKISGRLEKSGRLGHDPNIGALCSIAATLRLLGWRKNIEITGHRLKQDHVKPKNKFTIIANRLSLTLEKLTLPKSIEHDLYWHYEKNGEKLGTIFLHLVVENFSEGLAIYENHAGCERGYFITQKGDSLAIKKYKDRKAYKAGDKSQIIHIPDLVINDESRDEIINIEGKQSKAMAQGIKELDNFDAFEELYIAEYYPKHKIIRTVVLYGGSETMISKVEVSFLLNKRGELIINCGAPEIFTKSIKNLKDYCGV